MTSSIYRYLVGATLGAVTSVPAFAQSEKPAQLDEIIVTAQKRSENLQRVPVTVNAVTASMAATSGIRTSEDLNLMVPGLNITRSTAAALVYLRGIGTGGGQAGQEGAIATFIDGVYIPSVIGSTFSLNNIERVEVLKGPQGTLYGRNATGGAINIVTKTPSFTPAFQGEIGYGNLNTVEGSAYATTGLSKTIAIDLAGYYRNQADGFGHNVITGKDINKSRDIAVRSKALINLGEDTKVTLSGDFSKLTGDMVMAIRPVESTITVTKQHGYPYGFWDAQTDVNPYLNVKSWGFSGKIEHDLGVIQISSITAYRKLDAFYFGDLDFIELPLIKFPLTEKTPQFTEELQISGSGRIHWIAGLYYLDGNAGYEPFILQGVAFGGPNDGFGYFATQKTKSYAAYAQATVPLGERTDFTIGGRYTVDKRKLDVSNFVISNNTQIPTTTNPEMKATFKKPTWRFSLDHRLTDDVMVYASYSRGFKSGVFNLTAPTDDPVRPEVLDAYEAGFKSTLFDRRLRFNMSAFYYNYKGIQLQQVVVLTTLTNAAKAEVYGLDMDFDAKLTDRLSVRGGMEWLPGAKYKSFPNATTTTPDPINGGNAYANCAATPAVCDASGNRMIFAPKTTVNLAVDYTIPFVGGSLASDVSYAYNSGFPAAPDNRLRQGSYSLVNTQLLWKSASGIYRIRAFAKNLFNEKYYSQLTEVTFGDEGAPAPGRTYGASFGVSF